jgi:hypothetical protein
LEVGRVSGSFQLEAAGVGASMAGEGAEGEWSSRGE